MRGSGEEQRETIRPEFNSAIMIDFQGAKITSDTGFLLLREIDERFGILGPFGERTGGYQVLGSQQTLSGSNGPAEDLSDSGWL
jgi:hypothetical protein